MRCDLVVVGAGPAGSMTAKAAAEAGLDVVMLEKRQEIGDPIRCAEGVSKAALKPSAAVTADVAYDFIATSDLTTSYAFKVGDWTEAVAREYERVREPSAVGHHGQDRPDGPCVADPPECLGGQHPDLTVDRGL